MRIRRNYWFIPALALLGIIVAALHFFGKGKVREEVLVIDPKEPAPALPPSEPVKLAPKDPAATPAPGPMEPPHEPSAPAQPTP